jgi:hypothetical protein
MKFDDAAMRAEYLAQLDAEIAHHKVKALEMNERSNALTYGSPAEKRWHVIGLAHADMAAAAHRLKEAVE